MAGLMTAPMIAMEILLMGAMYKNRAVNIALVAVSAGALVLFFVLIRQQTAIADTQFLKSMIPHHSGAILMCQKASIQDAEIRKLCGTIIEGQRSEIAQMKERLNALVN